jgi:tetratricopeptide (TPR) repeat protein
MKRIGRLLRVVATLAALSGPLAACGPFYNDAHRGLDDPLETTLEEFYLGLYAGGPGSPLPARERAIAAEEAGRYAEAQTAWREVLARAGGNRDAIAIGREARIRLALLPQVGAGIAAEDFRLYATVRDDDTLALPVANTVGDLCAAVLLRQAEASLRAGDPASGLPLLDRARQAAATDGLRDEIELLRAAAPALAGIHGKGLVADPAAAVASLQAWLDAHPADQRRTEARGWQAFVIYHQPTCAPDGVAAAVRIYQEMLDDPAQRAYGAVIAVESLRYLYRGFHGRPPAGAIADPRHALAFAWFALRTGGTPDPALLGRVRDGVLAADPATVPAGVLAGLAQAWARTPDSATALILARRAYARAPDPANAYLLARLAAGADLPAEAAPLVETLIAAADPRATDALLRLGSAWGRAGRWSAALTAYIRADSEPDIAICCDGEMPLDDFIAFMQATPHLSPAAKGADWIPRLRPFLAVRLIRADRHAEALAWCDDGLRGRLAILTTLQDAVTAATPEQRPARLHALARYWYDQGRLLVFSDATWQQWACYDAWPYQESAVITPELAAKRERCRHEIEGMTTYFRAYPLFLEVADRYPDSPEAPACLYAAALCRYWLCGQTYLHYCRYWLDRSAQEDYAQQGDDLLRRLAQRYPQHPLATDAKVVRAVSGGGLHGR